MSRPEFISPDGISPALEDVGITGNVPEDMGRIADIMASYPHGDLVNSVKRALRSRPNAIAEHDRHKSTHFKYLLAAGNNGEYRVWAHEYLEEPVDEFDCVDASTGPVMVERRHNHTGLLVARMLTHGYRADEHMRPDYADVGLPQDDLEGWEAFAHSLTPRTQDYDAESTNNIMTIDPDEIHRIAKVQKGTISLVVKTNVVRDFSVVFSEDLRPLYAPAGVTANPNAHFERLEATLRRITWNT